MTVIQEMDPNLKKIKPTEWIPGQSPTIPRRRSRRSDFRATDQADPHSHRLTDIEKKIEALTQMQQVNSGVKDGFVYLSGTMEDYTVGEEDDNTYRNWRMWAANYLSEAGIPTLDPYRGDPIDYRRDASFVYRDCHDIDQSRCIWICWAKDINRQSIGTWSEFGYAIKSGVPIVFTDLTGNVQNTEHPFVKRFCARITTDLVDAGNFIKFMFSIR